MSGYFCRHCEAHSPDGGRCVVCGKHLGNWRKAWIAAVASTFGLIIVWILITAITQWQLPLMALLFGGTVSFCVTHFSGGRGIWFQLLATGFTFAGILLGDTIAMAIVSHLDGELDVFTLTGSEFVWHLEYRLKNDVYTAFFYVLGVMGGFCIWR